MSDVQDQGIRDAMDVQEPAADGQDDMFPEFEELRRQVAQRVRDNQRFLDGIFDEDFVEDEEDGEGGEEEEFFEEL
jgi:hypothetical protein